MSEKNKQSEQKDNQFVGAKPMSDEEVANARKRLASLSVADLNSILDTYTRLTKGLLTMTLKNTKDEEEIVEIERLKRLVNMAPKEELFLRSKDKIWAARVPIMEKNAAWFINRDYGSLIKKDNKQVMIETLISIIRDMFESLSEEEKELYWRKAIELLQLVATYKKLVGEE
jgi:hypothetical protein